MRGVSVNKSELVTKIAELTGFTKTDSTTALDAVFEAIKAALVAGEEVRLVGVGTFAVSKRKETKGHNPRTGLAITIPASNLPKFKPSSALKEAVNQ